LIAKLLFCAAQLATDPVLHPHHFFRSRWIVSKKFSRQPYCTERKTDHFTDGGMVGDGNLATAASQVNQQAFPSRSRFVRYHPKMNQAAFFQPGDNFDPPPCRG